MSAAPAHQGGADDRASTGLASSVTVRGISALSSRLGAPAATAVVSVVPPDVPPVGAP